jgi:phage host-nuclease inhibitor protein Gam
METADDAAGNGGESTFTPDTKERADWVLGKIADARSRAARIRENAETMAKQAEAEATFFEWKYGPALQAFARQELTGGKRKSLTLYNGTLGFRNKPASVSIGDTKAALAWARENLPEAVVETIDKKAIADALLSTGEAVDFAVLNAEEQVFYIK